MKAGVRAAWMGQAARYLIDLFLGYDTFISYAWSDGRPYAYDLCQELRKTGYRVFLDDREMPPGSVLTSSVQTGLRRSAALVLLLTEGSQRSSYVADEIKQFEKTGRPIIPIVLSSKIIEYNNSNIIDLSGIIRIDDFEDDTPSRPSPDVIQKLKQSFNFVRRNNVRIAIISAIAVTFSLVSALALVQLYRVETIRQRSDIKLMERTQPTEALVALAENRKRWFQDTTILADLSPDLIDAKLTVARHLIGDAVTKVSWGINGVYSVGSYDGAAYIWDANDRLLGKVPPQYFSNSADKRAPIPILSVQLFASNAFLSTVNYQGCLRVVRVSDAERSWANRDKTVFCDIRKPISTENYERSVIYNGPNVAVSRASGITLLDGDRTVAQWHPLSGGSVVDMAFGEDGSLYVRYADKRLEAIKENGVRRVVNTGQSQLGKCRNGDVWSATESGLFILRQADRVMTSHLVGKSPWLVSPNCDVYLDEGGSLYSLEKPNIKIADGIAFGWDANGNFVNVDFSASGGLLALSSHDGNISVYSVATGKREFQLQGHTSRLFSMAFSPDSSRFASAGLEGDIRIFSLRSDLTSGVSVPPGAEGVYAARAGGPVVSGERFDYTELRQIPLKNNIEVRSLIAPGAAKAVVIRDWMIGNRYVVADPDSHLVAICTEADCPDEAIDRRFDIETGAEARSSPDGRFVVAVSSAENYSILDLSRASSAPVLVKPDNGILSAAFDAHRHVIYLLHDGALGELPYDGDELSKVMRRKTLVCLSPDERVRVFHEMHWYATWRWQNCESKTAGN